MDPDTSTGLVQACFTVVSFQCCLVCFLDTFISLIDSASEADDLTSAGSPAVTSFSTGDCGSLRQSIRILNLANGFTVSWHMCLLVAECFFFNVDVALLFAPSFSCSSALRGFLPITCLMFCFSLFFFAPPRIPSSNSSSIFSQY